MLIFLLGVQVLARSHSVGWSLFMNPEELVFIYISAQGSSKFSIPSNFSRIHLLFHLSTKFRKRNYAALCWRTNKKATSWQKGDIRCPSWRKECIWNKYSSGGDSVLYPCTNVAPCLCAVVCRSQSTRKACQRAGSHSHYGTERVGTREWWYGQCHFCEIHQEVNCIAYTNLTCVHWKYAL